MGQMKLIGYVIVVVLIAGIIGYLLISHAPSNTTMNDSQNTANQTSQNGKLKIEDLKVGHGQEVKSGDTVVINYKGTLTDGTKFDSSYDHGQPFETQIGVGRVIKGWDEGVPGMKVGGKRRLTIPPSMGYGSQAVGNIPPNSTLIFDVELVGIK
jgi:FKBP-type peptidyl-prolyl cis-trans isomerase